MFTLFLVLLTPVLLGVALTGRRARRRLLAVRRGPETVPRARPRRRRPPSAPGPMPGPLLLELLAALLESGAPPATALDHLGDALSRVGDPRAEELGRLAAAVRQGVPENAATTPPTQPPGILRRRRPPSDDGGLGVLHDAIRMAVSAGLPPSSLVRRAAVEERRRAAAARQRATKRLEVLLVLPVGLCLLPAFVLIGIVPVVLDLLTE